jgi:hypothetical protein
MTHDLTYISGGASISSGLITWFGDNASAIGAIMTVATFLAFVTFSLLNYLINRRNVVHKETIKRDVIDALIDKAEQHEKEVIIRLVHK